LEMLLVVAAIFCACEQEQPAKNETLPVEAPKPSAGQARPTTTPEPEQEPEPVAAKPPEAVAAQHVLVAYRGAKNAPKEVTRGKAAAKKLADQVAAKARSGSDFTRLVKDYSEDLGTKDRLGSVGKFTPDKMVKPFSDAAFKLQVHEIS